MNSVIIANASFGLYNATLRTNCYIGSYSSTQSMANAYFDDLMFFNTALSSSQVQTVMNVYIPNMFNIISNSVTDQWSFNNNIVDSVTGLSLINPTNIQFVSDRTGAPNSAIYINNGSLLAPTATYFSGDFSITAWINMQSYAAWSRLVQCGTSTTYANDIYFALTTGSSGPQVSLVKNGTFRSISVQNQFPLSNWTHTAVSYGGTTGTFYVNSDIIANASLGSYTATLRTNCYIGSYSSTQSMANAFFDDLMFFNVALSSSQVFTVMNAYFPAAI